MKLISLNSEFEFIIEEDNPEVGCYLYVFKNNICIADILQNDIYTCKIIAYEEYGVAMDSWQQKD